jgi:hypothetical protein
MPDENPSLQDAARAQLEPPPVVEPTPATDPDPGWTPPVAADPNPDNPDLPDVGKVAEAPPDTDTMVTYGAGWAKATVDGTVYRLRRPFTGELRQLRQLLEGLTEEITLDSEAMESARRRLQRTEARARAQLVKAQQAVLDGADDAPTEAAISELEDDLMAQIHAARAEDRKAGRQLLDRADGNRERWWAEVFATLGLDGVPPRWPGWMMDPDGPGKLTEHWRSNPLAHG